VAFEARVVARFDSVFSIANGIAAWDAKRRAVYGLAMKSEAVKDLVMFGYSMAAQVCALVLGVNKHPRLRIVCDLTRAWGGSCS
jgi:hypothetical protein